MKKPALAITFAAAAALVGQPVSAQRQDLPAIGSAVQGAQIPEALDAVKVPGYILAFTSDGSFIRRCGIGPGGTNDASLNAAIFIDPRTGASTTFSATHDTKTWVDVQPNSSAYALVINKNGALISAMCGNNAKVGVNLDQCRIAGFPDKFGDTPAKAEASARNFVIQHVAQLNATCKDTVGQVTSGALNLPNAERATSVEAIRNNNARMIGAIMQAVQTYHK